MSEVESPPVRSAPGFRLTILSGDGMIRRLYPGILAKEWEGLKTRVLDPEDLELEGTAPDFDGLQDIDPGTDETEKEWVILVDLATLSSISPVRELLKAREEKRRGWPHRILFLDDPIVESDPKILELIQNELRIGRDFSRLPELLGQLRKIGEGKERQYGAPGQPSEEHHEKILVADDSKAIRNFVTRLLTGRGFQVETFENGQELLDYLFAGKTGDIILIDNQMPVKDGISTLQEIKSSPVHQDTPVLFLSAIKDKETIVQALELGADDYMEKPFNNNEFFARINVHLRIQSLKKQILLEKEKSDALLLNTLPRQIVQDLKETGISTPETFENVTVYFSDIVSFTNISATLEPARLIGELNEIFTRFDSIMEENGCERIKTIGDAYMAVSGMPEPHPDHGANMARAALSILDFMNRRNEESEIKWQIRIGIHTGPVVGGIVGVKKYLYDVFGDTINTASRMESNSIPMRINVSRETRDLLGDGFLYQAREPMEVKGKGVVEMFFLDGENRDS